MAVYIQILKIADHQESVQYEYSTVDDRKGVFSISKDSGEITVIKPLEGDDEKHLFARAVYKIKKHWESGEYPEKTCWAS